MVYTPSISVAAPTNPGSDQPVSAAAHAIAWRRLGADPEQRYLVYKPAHVRRGCPMMVCVHGISRNAETHILSFAPWADRYGMVLLAPLFDAKRFTKYQRLAKNERDRRADRILDLIIDETGKLTGAATDRLYMFGFSGGAQFVHRYTMAHPHRVARFVAVSAGWYTFPDPATPYPRGTGTSRRLPDLDFVHRDFLRIPGTVLVGSRDTRRDIALHYSSKVVEQQGTHRLERGRRWVTAMSAAARAHGFDTPYSFEELPDCGHSFECAMIRGDLGARVTRLLFPSARDQDR
jgi:pimeloyl-ACP methyl ester carboxylesterase